MERAKIKEYCQFCLKQQTYEHPKISINLLLKENFFKVTQKKVNENFLPSI